MNLSPLPEHPLVSIVTPSYNQAAFLERTIKSVLDQDYPHLEHILVDGASTDNSLEIIKKYKKKFAWWVSKKDNGQGEAINKGMAHAKGEIVAWLNSDDCYLPAAISAAVEAFESNPDAVMVYGDMLAIDENEFVTNTFKYRQLTLEDLLCFQIIGQPAVFMRRDAFENAGGLDTSFHLLLDHQLWIKIAMQGQLVHIPQTIAAARYHAGAKNLARASEFGREAFRILDWAQDQPDLTEVVTRLARRARASAHRVDARYLLDSGQPAQAIVAWTRALVTHPAIAFARMNILVSALLMLMGLEKLREWFLKWRTQTR
ncbi:MAG: glycosyltransferase [Anaerolineales bacterium]|nr:glycosyltransferase [Anaerolineales bacterium]